MYEVIFLFGLALVWILFATVLDLKKREIANWLNFSLIIFALGFRFFYSLFSENFSFLYQGLIGLGIFFVLGNVLYYGRLFAGGDAKLMIALGAILPISESFSINLRIFLLFLFIFLIFGAIYSLTISLITGLRNFKKFKKELVSTFKKNKKLLYLLMLLGLVLMLLGFISSSFFYFGVLVFVLPYFYIYAKAVDESCMIKKIKSSQLTVGDWLYKDLKIGKKEIKANWDGVSKKDIVLIKKNKKFVLIRQGIPFTPVFLVSFLIFLYFWKIGLWQSFGFV